MFKKVRIENGLLFNSYVTDTLNSIRSTTEDNLTDIFTQIPDEWYFENRHKNNIIDFLLYRKEKTEEHFNNLLI